MAGTDVQSRSFILGLVGRIGYVTACEDVLAPLVAAVLGGRKRKKGVCPLVNYIYILIVYTMLYETYIC